MAGSVSASWLRLIPLRDIDLRLFGTATTRFSELLDRRNLDTVYTTTSHLYPKRAAAYTILYGKRKAYLFFSSSASAETEFLWNHSENRSCRLPLHAII